MPFNSRRKVAITSDHAASYLKVSVGMTGHAYLFEIEGLFTRGSRSSRIVGEWSAGLSKWTVLICRIGSGTISSIPDPTLSLSWPYSMVAPFAQAALKSSGADDPLLANFRLRFKAKVGRCRFTL
jgi:hypothetical protein